jgi:hypothetical protein
MKRGRDKSFVVLLDSRSRDDGSSIYAPTFHLTKPICNVSHVRVKCVQFANTLFNVREGHNTIGLVGGVLGIVQPGYYTPSELTTVINGLSIGVTLAYDGSMLQWNVGTGTIDVTNSTLRTTLELQHGQTYTGTFQTRLFLASPMNVDFICSELQTSYYSYSGRERATNTQPLVSVPVLSGHGSMSFFLPTTLTPLDTGGLSFAQLSFLLCDSWTGEPLTDIGHWSMQIECFTK